jgi:hypothetical protein
MNVSWRMIDDEARDAAVIPPLPGSLVSWQCDAIPCRPLRRRHRGCTEEKLLGELTAQRHEHLGISEEPAG